MILKDMNIRYTGGNDAVLGYKGKALVWVIDGDCLYDLPVIDIYAPIFETHDEVIDVSSEYPDHDGITVRFIKDDQTMADLQTSEYFGNILLSEPEVVHIGAFPYGRYVTSPHAKFDGEKFIILNKDVSNLDPWHPKNPLSPTYNPNFGHSH